jgi:hypothetical protein
MFNAKRAPGEDGLSSEIILNIFRSFPSFLTEVYDKLLKEVRFGIYSTTCCLIWNSHIVPG